MKNIIIIILSIFLLFPNTSNAISIDDEAALGKEVDKEILKQYKYYNDPELQTYVSGVGQKIVASISDVDFKFHFKVVESTDVNAFALPGGYIYVTTGILAFFNSEAELAGVLGHEIGHVTSHHGIKQQKKAMLGLLAMLGGIAASVATSSQTENAGNLFLLTNSLVTQVLLGYGREAEMESDRLGMIYSYNSGYDPQKAVTFLKNLKFQEMMGGGGYHGFFATHPDTKKRIIVAMDMSKSLVDSGGEFDVSKERYLSHIKGLVYGGKRYKKDKKGAMKKKKYLDFYKVKKGDTFKSIATDMMKDKKESFRLAVINGRRESAVLEEGEIVKIIVRERPEK